MKSNKAYLKASVFIMTFLLLIGNQQTYAANNAGKVIFSFGSGSIKGADNKIRPLRRGATLKSGDEIITKNRTRTQIKLKDGSFFSLKPNTQFQIKSFVYKKSKKEDKSFFGLVRGGFRALTGLIGSSNKKAYRVTTPVATIGIRGTDFDVNLLPPKAGAKIGQLITFTNDGAIVIKNSAGEFVFGSGESGFVAGKGAAPRKATAEEAKQIVKQVKKDVKKEKKKAEKQVAKKKEQEKKQSEKQEVMQETQQTKEETSFDRWDNTDDLAAQGTELSSTDKLLSWITGDDRELHLPSSGTATYGPDSDANNSISPTDQLGITGTYATTTLSADFTDANNPVVTDVAVNITGLTGGTWAATMPGADIAITQDGDIEGRFTIDTNNSLSVIQGGSATTGTSTIEGIFTGDQAANAAMFIDFENGSNTASGAINLTKGGGS